MPVAADEDDVRLAAEHLDNKLLSDRRAEFIPPVKVEDEHALKIRLGNARDARADKMLAQEHTEHRRFGGIFKSSARKMHARAADTAVHEQSGIAALRAHGQQQQIPLRLLHLVDARAGQALRELPRQAMQKHCVHRHIKAPP